mmetsp:Transcript_19639/g.45743  ORF Transcript_19639/g.45743 Transcript_19639/m.45743 type:complete len:537 (+) Transcript_19639:127-1737(+)
MVESLRGFTFEGHLAPPDGQKCRLSYSFGEDVSRVLPPAVRKERRQLGWSCGDGVALISAKCSIPALGLQNEEVVVTLDPPAADGSTRILLQSTKRPELGLTVLQLSSQGDTLAGGDESWTPGAKPIIQASRGGKGAEEQPPQEEQTAPVAPPPRVSFPAAAAPQAPQSYGYPSKPEGPPLKARPNLPVAPGAASSSGEARKDRPRTPSPGSPAARGEGGGVLPVGDLLQMMESSTAGAPKIAAVAGGVGRSAGGTSGKQSAQVAPTRREARPDLAVSEESASASQMDPAELDRQIIQSEQDSCERLVAAAAHGDLPELRQLIARLGPNRQAPQGAGPNGSHSGWSPLAAAAEKGRTEAMAVLLEKKANVDAKDANGWTPLMHAVENQREEAVADLLKARASVQVEGASEGVTPLMLAAAGAHPSLCSTLLSAGALKEASDSTGRRAVHYAARGGRGGSLMALVEAKAKIDEKDKEGSTPLILAAMAGRTSSVRILLARRADITARNPEGRTAKDLASIWGHDRAAEVLRAAGGGG